MKLFYLFFFFLLFFNINAQKIIVLEGNLFNKENVEIPIATISLQSSLVATTSDFDGNFKLFVSNTSLPDTLVIRHISFETKKIFIGKINSDSLLNISLTNKINEIGTIEISALSASSIINKVIYNIDKNYHSNSYFVDGFYRQKHKENNKYVRLIECFATVKENITDRKSEKQKELFLINEIRRSNNYERNGDKHGDHLVDLFSEDPINYSQQSFLNINNISNYLFSFLESKNTNQAKIFFQNKEWKMPKNKSGYIVINKEDFAVLEIEITSTQNPLYKKDMKSNWKFQNGVYKAFYTKKNDKYYCSKSCKYYNHYVLNEYTKQLDFIVEEYFDWYSLLFTKNKLVDAGTYVSHGKNLPPKNTYNLFSNLYSKKYQYNSTFWKNAKFQKIKAKVYNDLNSFQDIETQYLYD